MNPEARARSVKNIIPPIVNSWIVPNLWNQSMILLKVLPTTPLACPEIKVVATPTRTTMTIAVQTHLAPIWKGAKWVWTAIVIVVLVGVATTLISGQASGVVGSTFSKIIDWFHKFGTIQLFTIGGIIFLTLLALASGFITVILKSYGPQHALAEVQVVFDYIKADIEAKTHKEELLQDRKKEAFIQYLHAVEETNKYIRLRGYAQISQEVV